MARLAVAIAFGVVAAGLLLLVALIPVAAAVVECLRDFDWALAAPTQRMWTLLVRGVGVAAGAAALSVLVGAGLAVGLAARRGTTLGIVTRWLAIAAILTPPYLYAYAWSWPLIPSGVLSIQTLSSPLAAWSATIGRSVACLACWSAPVAAAILAAGWRRTGCAAVTLARLDASGARAMLYVGLRAMGPHLLLAWLVAFVLCVTEFSVCHLCAVPTWNTEILAQAQILPQPGRVMLLAWPLLAIVAGCAVALWALRRPMTDALVGAAESREDADAAGVRAPAPSRGAKLALGLAAVFALAPIVMLAAGIRHVSGVFSAWPTYAGEWRYGLAVGAMAAVFCTVLALAVDLSLTVRRLRATGVSAAALLAALAIAPPTLVGDAFLAAYQSTPLLRDHLWIVALVTTARFAAIPVLMLVLAGRQVDPGSIAAARVDRADAWSQYWRVRLPQCRAALAAGVLSAALLSVGEVSASHMVTPPGAQSISVALLNAIHFGRDDQVLTMSLALVAAAALGAMALARVRPR